jgi:hypothetical protein
MVGINYLRKLNKIWSYINNLIKLIIYKNKYYFIIIFFIVVLIKKIQNI